MKILMLHAADFNRFWAHYYFYKDPFFINELEKLGYRLVLSTQTKVVDCDKVLFVEATSVGLHRFRLKSKIGKLIRKLSGCARRDLYQELKECDMLGKAALAALEVESQLPENGSSKLHSLFPVVFTPNDNLVDNKHIFKMCSPQPVNWPTVEPIAFANKKLLTNISSNKYSKHELELYSARRRDILYCSAKLPDDFDLYGFGWNAPVTSGQRTFKFLTPIYSSYKGVVSNPADIFPKYRFALCYENASILGNIDEKIFQCMRSDCVPVFLGAPNVKKYVDEEAFIDRRRFNSEDDLKRYLVEMTEGEYENYRKAIKSYLASQRFASFLSPAFAETIIRGLETT